ncbi:TerC family protein [Rhodobacteraceae bacterium nBUS_24]|jgi:YjbE family integral membrane protein|nr:TerC family protein [Marinovum sp.]MBT4871791.1 TerC family protein [Marinovum sp.]MBT6099814.1 TerC family protein [Marinovum sp.]MBT6507910.1 TerC family protein [Marinovum sp.]MBT6533517.1 TerC family protein [Marinovum sp.]
MIAEAGDIFSIIVADIVLSGDNALIIGMAAASLPQEMRKKAIFYGMVVAALLRIVFAVIATKLLGIPGLLFVGALLLFWVCWRLFGEIREANQRNNEDSSAAETEETTEQDATDPPRKTMRRAMIYIMVADVSMSIDNVLAVAAIADGDTNMLIFGLALAIALMAFAATLIMKLLARFPIISWLGLAVLVYVAAEMFHRGLMDPEIGVLAFLQAVPPG